MRSLECPAPSAPERSGSEPPGDRLGPANGAALGVLVAVFAIEATSRLVRTRRFDVDSLGDFLINLVGAQTILASGSYREFFYYPVPYLILQEWLGALGVPAASLLWFGLMVMGGVGALALAIDGVGLAAHRRRWPLALAATFGVYYFVQWDLRAGNSNLIVLGLTLLALRAGSRGRVGSAGALLSFAVACKLYALVFVPYLAWRREWRWLACAVLGLFGWFVALPRSGWARAARSP